MTVGETPSHSWMGASSASRWMACPGSVGLCQAINPPAQTSVYAEEGTKAHAVCEAALGGAEDWELEFLGATPEMVDGAAIYYDYIKNVSNKKSILYVEHRISIPYDKESFGTADAIVHNPDILHVFDYKYGVMPVEVEDNPQLRFYAIGAYFSLLKKAQKKIKTVTVTVVQPRAEHDKWPVRCEVLSIEELLAWGETVLKPAMEACRKPNAPFFAGPHCKYCPVFVHCPLNGAVADFEVATPPEALPEPKELTLEKIGAILQHGSRVEDWIAAVRKHAYNLAMNGTAIPGYKLVAGRSSRDWSDEKKIVELLGDQAFGPRKLISPAQAEKLKLSVDLEPFVRKTSGSPILVPESSKKLQIASSAESDFQNG